MNLYIIRHAHAVAIGVAGAKTDEERPLSPQGAKQAELLAPSLQRQGVTLEMIVTSPLLRARQTAESILRKWSSDAPPALHVSKSLSPDQPPRKLAKFLQKLGGENVAVVGHDPHLAVFAGWIIGSKKARIEIAKGGVALITLDEAAKGAGTLQWLVTPKLLGKE